MTTLYTVTEALLGRKDTSMNRRGTQRGTVIRRGGNWSVRYRQLVTASDGSIQYKQTTKVIGPVCDLSLKAAEAEAAKIVSGANSVTAAPASIATLREFVDLRFRPERVSQLRPSGKAHYAYILDRLILSSLGDHRLSDIRPSVVQAYLNQLGKTYSMQTVTHARNALSAVFSYARLLDFHSGSLPTEDVFCSGTPARPNKSLSIEQFRNLLRVVAPEYRLLVETIARSGMRVGEALGLCWDCVNTSDSPVIRHGRALPPRSILVIRSFSRGAFGPPKTARSERIVPLPTAIIDQLRVIEPAAAGELDPVFKSSAGTPLDAHNIARRHLKVAGKLIGAPWLHWHALRHTAASLIDLDVVARQKVLGHASAAMTAHYTHPDLERVREAMERVQ